MRQPDVIMTNMASALTQWVTRTQAGWMVAPAGDRETAKSADPTVMGYSYTNSDDGRPHKHVRMGRRRQQTGRALRSGDVLPRRSEPYRGRAGGGHLRP